MDDFDVLGVSKTASEEEIKKAYRDLMRKWHPDAHVGNEEFATQESQKINKAYERIMKKIKNEPEDNNYNEINFYAQREDLNKKKRDIITKYEKLKNRLSTIEHNIYYDNFEQDNYRNNIQKNLKELIREIKMYYESKNYQNNKKIFSNKKLQSRLRTEEESIMLYLQALQEKIEKYFEANEDNKVFEISITEVGNRINNIFPYLLASIQNSIEKYKEQYEELVKKINNNQNEKEIITKQINLLEQAKDKIDDELNKIEIYYKANPEQLFKDASKTAPKFDFFSDYSDYFDTAKKGR